MTELLHNPKIKPEHLVRKAIVYLRQSSEKQVRQNKESQLLQYAMAERVRALGWQEVEIINNDLGSSAGLAAAQREGFERVLSSVALGEVGIVSSREVSRLSRTDKDWCRLLEVCQIFGTLIADEQSASSSSKFYANECWQGRRQKRAAANCSKGFRLGMPATPWVRSCFIPIDGSAKRYSSCSLSFENCGACVRHSNGSVITTWSYRSIPYRERA